MFCSKCGNKVDLSQPFCNKCGNSVNASKAADPRKKPSGAINKIYIIAGITVAALVALFFMLKGGGVSSSANLKNEITQTVKSFNDELNNCFDLSVYFDGGNIDISPLEEYTDGGYALGAFYEINEAIENTFGFLAYLPIGGELGGNIGSALLSEIPIIGNVLGDMAENEIKNDPLLNKDLWKKAIKISISPSDIEIGEDKKSATLFLNTDVKMGDAKFKKSKIAKLAGMDMEPLQQSIRLSATMVKNENGKWVFTEIMNY